MPSGVYRLKVVASDRKDNAPAEALTGEKVSEPFAVSHVPPAVTLKVVGMDGDKAVVEATGVSEYVRLTGASFSVNGKKWASVFPTDGLFDSKEETFRSAGLGDDVRLEAATLEAACLRLESHPVHVEAFAR